MAAEPRGGDRVETALADSGPYSDVIWVSNFEPPEAIGSTRIMAIMPAEALGGRVAVFRRGTDPERFIAEQKPRLLIFTKNFDNAILRLARSACERGIPVMSIFCDWRFDDQRFVATDRPLARMSRKVIVQTAAMRAAVREHFGADAAVIEEPLYLPGGEPRFSPDGALKLLWYGHPNNFDTLPRAASELTDLREPPLSLCLMSEQPLPPETAESVRWQSFAAIRFAPFSLAAQAAELAACDLVVIPTLPTEEKTVKPAGRLVAAIQSGRFAVAHDHPAHRELADYCWCGDDLAEGVRWALGHPDEALSQLSAGQDYVRQRFSMDAVCRGWAREIDRVLAVA